MQRCKELEHYIEEYRANRLNRKRAEITATPDTLLPSLTDALDILIQEQCRMQREGSQEKVKYILFHPLLTSVCTGSLETAAGMGNFMLYLDKHMSYTYWKPESIYQDMDKDMEEVRRLLGQKFVRIEEYEMLFLKRRLYLDDWTLFCEALKPAMGSIEEKIKDSALLVEEEVQVLCGGYMEKLDIVGSMSGGKQ